jgi:hypothetical protein
MSKRQRRQRDKRRRHEQPGSPRAHRVVAGAGLTIGATFAMGGTAHGTDFTVNSALDNGDGTCEVTVGECTLRDAVDDANTAGTADRVLFQSDLSGTIDIAVDDILISDQVEILGPGSSQLAVDAGDTYRIFDIDLLATGEPVLISGLTLANGEAELSAGGAIFNGNADLTVSDSTLSSNSADFGGAVAGQVTISNSVLSGNDAFLNGGALDNYGSTGSVVVESTTLSGNTAGQMGGAIYNDDDLRIYDSTVSGNHADNSAGDVGGGIANIGGEVHVIASTISGNSAGLAGGGIYNYSGYLLVDRSTVSGNESEAVAGGLESRGTSTMYMINSTLSGNSTVYGGGGAEDQHDPGFPFRMYSTTVAGNTSDNYAGGINDYSFGAPVLRNTIVGANTAPSDPDLGGPALRGRTFDAGFTLVGALGGATVDDASYPGSNITGQDPQLQALADNGGPTLTRAPLVSSPAVDKGSSFGADTDQRGSPRPSDFTTIPNSTAAGADGADIGAFELGAPSAGGAAVTPPKCKGKTATVFRTGLSRTLTGTNKRDVIVGTPKKDTINTKGGNDLVCAKGGKDTVKGKGGKDKLLGQGGKDTLKGGAGKDTLKGGAGKDKLFGQGGKDKLVGGAKDDTCVGGAGADTEKSC